ncbi:unnamed protein product [Urochloa humidicola]
MRKSSLAPDAAAALVVFVVLVAGSLGFEVSANKINSSAYPGMDPSPFAVALLRRDLHVAINASTLLPSDASISITARLRAALSSTSSRPLQHLQHWSSSEPPTGSGDAVLLPAGDVSNHIFGSSVMLCHDFVLIHLKPSHSEAPPHRPHASVTPLEAIAGDLLDVVVGGSMLSFRDLDVIGFFFRGLLVSLLLLI